MALASKSTVGHSNKIAFFSVASNDVDSELIVMDRIGNFQLTGTEASNSLGFTAEYSEKNDALRTFLTTYAAASTNVAENPTYTLANGTEVSFGSDTTGNSQILAVTYSNSNSDGDKEIVAIRGELNYAENQRTANTPFTGTLTFVGKDTPATFTLSAATLWSSLLSDALTTLSDGDVTIPTANKGATVFLS